MTNICQNVSCATMTTTAEKESPCGIQYWTTSVTDGQIPKDNNVTMFCHKILPFENEINMD
ncbi:hypothetical protein DERP_011047 [Dermatophagoides pteronyssinus]|uniref:Uncharacterized protein n=1 Tax=Dermatophagoides pteronyssinus TaxID=6956 RepID=A0ABQ8JW43_DERPT|nr:hypothetical protein DERP_011047 [Dermatophagoides pteronyssinus]